MTDAVAMHHGGRASGVGSLATAITLLAEAVLALATEKGSAE